MSQINQQQVDKVLTILITMWRKVEFSEFHYMELVKIIRANSGCLALSTYCIETNLFMRPSRGHLKFLKKPDMASALKAHIASLAAAARNARKTKKKRAAKEHVMPLPRVTRKIDEQYCIQLLKSKGYKILKPVSQYEEI